MLQRAVSQCIFLSWHTAFVANSFTSRYGPCSIEPLTWIKVTAAHAVFKFLAPSQYSTHTSIATVTSLAYRAAAYDMVPPTSHLSLHLPTSHLSLHPPTSHLSLRPPTSHLSLHPSTSHLPKQDQLTSCECARWIKHIPSQCYSACENTLVKGNLRTTAHTSPQYIIVRSVVHICMYMTVQ